jgi:hypothetical protein
METVDELSRREILALKDIQLSGRTTDCATMLKFLNENIIFESQDGRLQLTSKGRRMLVRGSPLLWDLAS